MASRFVPGTVAVSAIIAFLTPSAAVVAQQAGSCPCGNDATIQVSATGTVTATPDQATLSLAVETTAANAADAVRENAGKMQRIMKALDGLGIPKDHVATTSYDVQPQYARQRPEDADKPPSITGYRASNMLQVTLDDVTLPGRVIDAGIAAGANRVAGLSFGLKDPAPTRLEALRQAMHSAQEQARAMAEAAGQTLGPPLRLSTEESPLPVARSPIYMAQAMAAPAPTPVESGQLKVSARVDAVYRLVVGSK
jgi:uncharacterized protein